MDSKTEMGEKAVGTLVSLIPFVGSGLLSAGTAVLDHEM